MSGQGGWTQPVNVDISKPREKTIDKMFPELDLYPDLYVLTKFQLNNQFGIDSERDDEKMSLAGKKSVKVWIETDANKRFKSENSGFVDIRDIISVINRSNTSGKCIAISCNDGFIFSNHIIGVFPIKDDE